MTSVQKRFTHWICTFHKARSVIRNKSAIYFSAAELLIG
jgi:hypothetical protein